MADGRLFAARDAYFRARGGTIVVGVCAPRNRASLRALKRDGATVVGRVKQIALPFTFKLFGQNRNSFYVSINGHLNTDNYQYYPWQVPNVTSPNGVIAPGSKRNGRPIVRRPAIQCSQGPT